MVRAPCCEKMGLKKGPWTSEEDQILINYINLNGHSNWRALPKLAGLSRCGKSCRLRWINYLRPDLKRGNFCREEEDAIIKLHEKLGNRWSAIAAEFPGRTDNEIKNVWHTHLKKRVTTTSSHNQNTIIIEEKETDKFETATPAVISDSNNILPEADESFWSEVLSGDNNGLDSPISDSIITSSPTSQFLPSVYFPSNFWEVFNNNDEEDNSGENTTTVTVDSPQISSTSSTVDMTSPVGSDFFPELDMMSYNYVWPAYNNNNQKNEEHSSAAGAVDHQDYSFNTDDDDMVFWYNVFTRPEELAENI